MIIDSHSHFDERIDGTAVGAANEIARQMGEAGIDKVIALHLEMQPWSPEEISNAIKPHPGICAFVNVHPHSQNCQKELLDIKFKNWAGDLEQVDDVTLIGIKI